MPCPRLIRWPYCRRSAEADMKDLHIAVVDIEDGRLSMTKAMDFVADPRFGGVACFMGRVRNHNLGRQVTGISYDIFEPLALNTFRAIAERARNEVGDPLKLYIAHARRSEERRGGNEGL